MPSYLHLASAPNPVWCVRVDLSESLWYHFLPTLFSYLPPVPVIPALIRVGVLGHRLNPQALYPAHFGVFVRAAEEWSDSPDVTTSLIKFMMEFVYNKASRQRGVLRGGRGMIKLFCQFLAAAGFDGVDNALIVVGDFLATLPKRIILATSI